MNSTSSLWEVAAKTSQLGFWCWHIQSNQIHQILSNLLDNAIKFTKKGQVRFNIRVIEADKSLSITKQIRLRFEVIDTGVGIRHELLAKIFQPFEQLGTLIERAEGTGLGLTITRQLVQLMGGEINVESTVGQGSHFWFDLNFDIAEWHHRQCVVARQGKASGRGTRLMVPQGDHQDDAVRSAIIWGGTLKGIIIIVPNRP